MCIYLQYLDNKKLEYFDNKKYENIEYKILYNSDNNYFLPFYLYSECLYNIMRNKLALDVENIENIIDKQIMWFSQYRMENSFKDILYNRIVY